MLKSVQIHELGGADRLVAAQSEHESVGANRVSVLQTHAGVNFVDVYHRTGLYPLPSLPAILGVEGAGTVDQVGDGVTDLTTGMRVAYAAPFAGAYASQRVIDADRLVKIPDTVPNEVAAATMLRGVTAHMLLEDVYRAGPETTILVHAAAGGLGLILVQWAKFLGARVIGTVGSPEKADIAHMAGADHTILYREVDFVRAVKDLTDGKGADIAFDGIGADTLIKTFDSVRPFGMVASIGQSAGPVRDIAIAEIGPRRSLIFARPSSFAYMSNVGRYRRAAHRYLALLASGAIRVSVESRYRLEDAARAHEDMEGRRTTGPVVLET